MKHERDEPEAASEWGLEEFERELRALLRVEPSAQLAERVRTQLRESSPSRRPVRLLLPAIAAVLALVLLTALLQRRPQAPAGRPQAATQESPSGATHPAPPSTVVGRPPAPVRTRVPPPARSAAVSPQVIVPPGQDEAVLRFVAAVNERRLAAPRALSEPALDTPLPPPAPIAIAPLEAAPPFDTADAPARSDS